MVKQFTIPCSFNGEAAPVTFYIGHPESGHHPINFQMNWLSSAKGGVVPQDLVDTLKNLQDLAYENGADFEEMCYYALISATSNNTAGNGVTKESITGYADEFIKNELGEDYVEDTLAAADSQDDTQTQARQSQQTTSDSTVAQNATTSKPSSSSTGSDDSDLMDDIDSLLTSPDDSGSSGSNSSGSNTTYHALSLSSLSSSSNYSDNDDLLMDDNNLLSDNVDSSASSSSASSSQTSDDNSLANEIDELLKELSGESVSATSGKVNSAVYGEDEDLL